MRAIADLTHYSQRFSECGETRLGTENDAVRGVVPGLVVAPATPEDVAAALAVASHEGLSVVLRGGGTKLAWGRRPQRLDVILDMRRLNRVLTHAHGDLTATVQGGAALETVNRELGSHRQWLPVDSAFGASTIGGLIATNDSGPLRHRHGTPRDLLIGVSLATTDGRVVKAGGQVVKNVAGYDLGKLVSGSCGTFAAIVSATFKLSPLPRSSKTLVAAFRDRDDAARAVGTIASSQLEPLAFEIDARHSPAAASARLRLLVRFASTPRAVDAEIDQAQRMTAGADVSIVSDDAETALWRDRVGGIWSSPGAFLKLSWRPAAATEVLNLVDDICRTERVTVEFVGRAALGAGLLRVEGDAASEVRAIERVRAQTSPFGHVRLLSGSGFVGTHVDVWGAADEAAVPLQAIKRAFDPAGILNAGRGPV